MAHYQYAQNQAHALYLFNKEQRERVAEIKKLYEDRAKTGDDAFAGESERITEETIKQRGIERQREIGAGLPGTSRTTVKGEEFTGAEAKAQASLLAERTRYKSGQEKELADFLERIEHQGPNLDRAAALMKGLGAGGYGHGGGHGSQQGTYAAFRAKGGTLPFGRWAASLDSQDPRSVKINQMRNQGYKFTAGGVPFRETSRWGGSGGMSDAANARSYMGPTGVSREYFHPGNPALAQRGLGSIGYWGAAGGVRNAMSFPGSQQRAASLLAQQQGNWWGNQQQQAWQRGHLQNIQNQAAGRGNWGDPGLDLGGGINVNKINAPVFQPRV